MTLQRIDIPRYHVRLSDKDITNQNQQHNILPAHFNRSQTDNQNLFTTIITSDSDHVPPTIRPTSSVSIKPSFTLSPNLIPVLPDLEHCWPRASPLLGWLNQAAGPGYLCRQQVIISSSSPDISHSNSVGHWAGR